MTFTFVLKLCFPNGKLLRATIDVPVLTDFTFDQLCQEIRKLSPAVDLSTLTWKDDEQDVISLESDSGVVDALRHMQRGTAGGADILRICANVLQSREPGESSNSVAMGQRSCLVDVAANSRLCQLDQLSTSTNKIDKSESALSCDVHDKVPIVIVNNFVDQGNMPRIQPEKRRPTNCSAVLSAAEGAVVAAKEHMEEDLSTQQELCQVAGKRSFEVMEGGNADATDKAACKKSKSAAPQNVSSMASIPPSGAGNQTLQGKQSLHHGSEGRAVACANSGLASKLLERTYPNREKVAETNPLLKQQLAWQNQLAQAGTWKQRASVLYKAYTERDKQAKYQRYQRETLRVDTPAKLPPPRNYFAGLSDELLEKLFAYLQLADRLNASEVCRRWARVTGMPWLDVTDLDLSEVPSKNMGAIVRSCPKISSLYCADQTIIVNDVNRYRQDSLEKMTLLNVELTIPFGVLRITESLTRFLRGFPALSELSWHSVTWQPTSPPTDNTRLAINRRWYSICPVHECTSLTKLQLTGCSNLHASSLFESLCASTSLESVVLGGSLYVDASTTFGQLKSKVAPAMKGMRSLRELSLVNVTLEYSHDHSAGAFGEFVLSRLNEALQGLQTLVVVQEPDRKRSFQDVIDSIAPWIENHPSLRLLVVAAGTPFRYNRRQNKYVDVFDIEEAVEISPRRRFAANGVNALPFLNVFVSGSVARKAFFVRSPAAKIWPIDKPMPAFLEQPEVAKIFEGVWTAQIVKSLTDRNIDLWRFDRTLALTVNQIDDA